MKRFFSPSGIISSSRIVPSMDVVVVKVDEGSKDDEDDVVLETADEDAREVAVVERILANGSLILLEPATAFESVTANDFDRLIADNELSFPFRDG